MFLFYYLKSVISGWDVTPATFLDSLGVVTISKKIKM